MLRKFILILLLILVSSCSKNVLEGPFKVINVIDGDTLDLNNSKRVRLSGINTPETGECYYEEAKNKLAELVLDKDVFLEKDISDEDKYGRLLRYVYIDDSFVNSILVKEGYARVYDKYSYDTRRYNELKEVEFLAKENNLGLWGCVDSKNNCLYVRSKSSKTYHKPDCKWVKRIKPENLICIKDEEELEGLKPCKTCIT